MGLDKITGLRVGGLKCLGGVQLQLGPLTVLIGENGSGKSTIVEACELLRRAGTPQFSDALHSFHGGPLALLSNRRPEVLELCVDIEGDGPPITYELVLQEVSGRFHVRAEDVFVEDEEAAGNPDYRNNMSRVGNTIRFWNAESKHLDSLTATQPEEPALLTWGRTAPSPAIDRVIAALSGIEVQLPVDTVAAWAARSSGRQVPPSRMPEMLAPAARVEKFGRNLASVYHALKNEHGDAHWNETMEYVRLGLGDMVESVGTSVDPGGGAVSLTLKRRDADRPIRASSLSDGTLAYLAFVALLRLTQERSLLVIDEPELHLHPLLLGRVVQLLEAISNTVPVVLTTHSDRLLDALSDPGASVVTCNLDGAGVTQVARPDKDTLDAWLQRYRGLGSMRAEGVADVVFKAPSSASS